MNPLVAIVERYRDPIEEALDGACQWTEGCPPPLREAIRYALLAPGKRLRPSLVLMAAEACGGRIEDAIPSAVAVEMIHAYSLIHDDLPAMDDDDLRRGRPTTHIQFGEATAILAGDALQAEAFSVIAQSNAVAAIKCDLLSELARASGATGLVGGQVDDLRAEEMTIESVGGVAEAKQFLEAIHRRKTGALFVACVRLGAISVKANQPQIEALSSYASAFGLAFQITDDVLDCTAKAEDLGKRTQKDAKRGKFTYPTLLVSPLSRQPGSKSPSDSPLNGSNYAEVCESDIESESDIELSDGITAAKELASQTVAKARQSLELFGSSADRLHLLAEYIAERSA